MRIYRAKDYRDMSRKAANILSAQVIMKPDAVLGLATGSTPEGTYAQLIEWYNKGDIDFSQVTTVNLDEYKGLLPDDEQSYHYFMHKHFFDHIKGVQRLQPHHPLRRRRGYAAARHRRKRSHRLQRAESGV